MTTHKVLITGITGFVGPYLARQLLHSGNEVTGLIRRHASNQKPKSLKEMDIVSNIDLIDGDISELTTVLSAIQKTRPDWIFHLAAQTFVPHSFTDPLETFRINCMGTQNVLEAIRLKNIKSRVIFAGSSEEYGLQFKNEDHFETMTKKYGNAGINPQPKAFPELPVDESSYLRPMSPYATSKVYGDYAFRNYYTAYGTDTVVSRAFNHEGAGRGHNFVTSTIIRQIVSMHLEKQNVMTIGDVQSFRDWSHVEDIISGYILLAERAEAGSVYVQGSMRTNSVLTYILSTISELGYEVNDLYTIKGDKKIKDPLAFTRINIGKMSLDSNVVDQMLFSNELEYGLYDEGLVIDTNKRKFKIQFDPSKYRPSDVPILLSNIGKIKELGFRPKRQLIDIINDQINYYLDPNHREDHLLLTKKTDI